MLPVTEIYEGDQYENPLLRPNGCAFVVIEIDRGEKMIKVQPVNSRGKLVGKPFWKKNTDKMFSENWRVFCGKDMF